ncbi:valine--tRNA ligase [Haloglomus halophilum]|uniref:valine--tRNA ligase n=1 Tax=Haloglomus halophilum TaxID=2962672 RepID=UPI0020C95329|nr:valine--tRNA ligase [Haloglomus halophilum]
MPSGSYDPDAVEPAWQDRWVETDTYAYESVDDPDLSFSIDTPPPTVSGDLHWGHVYGATLQDFVARFQRMANGEVFFPFGYDDNGIASERLTEDELGIEHSNFERREFQRKCREVCAEYEADFTEKMQALGVSIDWGHTYQTIEPRVQRISQRSFIDLYEQGREYRRRAPTIWCPDCATAISQVETEDDERGSHFHDIEFDVVDSDEAFTISTTRPELLPACVSVFVHPDDDENEHLVGEEARIPLFGQEVPIIEDERVDMETGSGVVMCCTFGDQTDIEWYQAHDLPLRIAIDETGTMTEQAGDYQGMDSDEAREAIVADLDETGALLDKRAITHSVNVHERCDTPVEFLVTEQWYVEILDKKEEYLQAGREMDWYPEKMFTRYKHWIEGLEWDWCISRQRSSGIPFPVWYCESCDEAVVADRADLPVDPLSDEPPVDACPECGHDEFEPEDDVFDTWATSSLTPLINAGWAEGDDDPASDAMARPELYPMDMRPQGHDIISFWLFHTVVKCYEHTGEPPFESVMINGMVLDENRKKMSKSVGNIVAPDEVLEKYPVDAARYWAAGSSVGDDLPYKEKGIVSGERLLQKLWNASKLVDELAPADEVPDEQPELAALDEWLLARLDEEAARAAEHLESRAFSKYRDSLRSFFWHTFCDDYLEIAKGRIRETDDPGARYTLRTAHERFLKLFAPVLSHVTEELWHDMYVDADSVGATSEDATAADGGATVNSIHRTDWPEPLGLDADIEGGERALEVVSALRKYKSERDLALNTELDHVEVYGDVADYVDDIARAMHVETLDLLDEAPEVETVVTGIDLDYSVVGPEFGGDVPDIEAAIESGEYVLEGEGDDATLIAGEHELTADMFDVEEERRYDGKGDLLETDGAVVIVG